MSGKRVSIALLTRLPGRWTKMKEVNEQGYERGITILGVGKGLTMVNITPVFFPKVRQDWRHEIVGFAAYDLEATTEKLLFLGPLTTPRRVSKGESMRFDPGSIVLQVFWTGAP
jgi:hypothetical protein